MDILSVYDIDLTHTSNSLHHVISDTFWTRVPSHEAARRWRIGFYIRDMMKIDEIHFGFVPGRATADAIFVVCQLQEKHIDANKRLHFSFVDLEKAFDSEPWKILWCTLKSLGVGNGICMSSSACTPTHGVECGSMVSTVRSLVWELVRIRILSLVHHASRWCYCVPT